MDIVLAYFAGLLTLINPCVLPVLPIVLASALQVGRTGPLVLALGMGLSFVVLGVVVSAFGHAIGLYSDNLTQIGAVLMIGFGLILLVPRFGAVFSTATAGMAARADGGIDTLDRGSLTGQFAGGVLLGVVWSPCIGPTLGGAIALASQGESLGWAAAVMTGFALGVGTLIVGLGYGARGLIGRNKALLHRLAAVAQPVMGGVFVVVGLMLVFRVHHVIEAWALDNMPEWIIALSVAL